MRADPAAVNHARVEDIGGHDVVDKAATGELVGQIEPREALADIPIFRGSLGRSRSGGVPGKTYLVGERPVIMACRGAAKHEAPVFDGEVRRVASDLCRGGRQEEGADLGTDQPDGAAGLEDRVASGGEALRWARTRITGEHTEVFRRDVQFIGGDLRQRGQNALTEFNLARGDADLSAGLEHDPAVQARIVGETLGEGVAEHRQALARIAAAARLRRG